MQNLVRWRRLVEPGDVEGICAALVSLEVNGIEMRKVSPIAGILTEAERPAALNSIRRS
ncbi:hypothetical protein [Kocuria sabuli]|uniref:hypothetical protein n=1 Tax=Kocuria sabuli TaxID=3071448 RepID=UPI0034D3E7DE